MNTTTGDILTLISFRIQFSPGRRHPGRDFADAPPKNFGKWANHIVYSYSPFNLFRYQQNLFLLSPTYCEGILFVILAQSPSRNTNSSFIVMRCVRCIVVFLRYANLALHCIVLRCVMCIAGAYMLGYYCFLRSLSPLSCYLICCLRYIPFFSSWAGVFMERWTSFI